MDVSGGCGSVASGKCDPAECNSVLGWEDSSGWTCNGFYSPCNTLYTPSSGPWAYVNSYDACCECQAY